MVRNVAQNCAFVKVEEESLVGVRRANDPLAPRFDIV